MGGGGGLTMTTVALDGLQINLASHSAHTTTFLFTQKSSSMKQQTIHTCTQMPYRNFWLK